MIRILNRRHLVHILREYLNDYYHPARTHLGLDRDSPNHREVEPPEKGAIIERSHRFSRACQTRMTTGICPSRM